MHKLLLQISVHRWLKQDLLLEVSKQNID
jgi:hypothetical protein